jgi:peptidoglycan/LPS O-acetylase OafA/YrhL
MGIPQDRTGAGKGRGAAVELPALTALRGIAALAVVLFHSAWLAYNHAGGAPPLVWRRGYLAVDLFFFLSGFVLTHAYGSRLIHERSWQTIGAFLWARFCRIYPASLFVTLVYVLAYTVGSLAFPWGVSFKTQLTASVLLMQVPWLDEVWINRPAWSISAELYAYLLFPFVVPILLRLKRPTAITVAITLLIGIAIEHTISAASDGWLALLRALPEFAVGSLVYRAYSEQLFRTFWEKDATLLGLTALIVAACSVDGTDAPIVILLLALLLAAVSNSGHMAGVLNARPLRWLGDVSYSVYIFQSCPLMVAVALSGVLVAHGLGGIWFEAVSALFALGGGVLVHRCVDVPARAALRRLPDRLAAMAAARRNLRSRNIVAAVKSQSFPILAGIVPAIAGELPVDPRNKPGDDESRGSI